MIRMNSANEALVYEGLELLIGRRKKEVAIIVAYRRRINMESCRLGIMVNSRDAALYDHYETQPKAGHLLYRK
jgi:hypothetical protein